MINDVTYFESNEIIDIRGSFLKVFSKTWVGSKSIELEESFVTRSKIGSTRGMHLQVGPTENWKIISVIEGHIFDVLVDMRKHSETFLKTNTKYLKDGVSILCPPGIAHGFQALENSTLIYCSSKTRDEKFDLGFNVKSLVIDWPLSFEVQSVRDKSLPHINDFLNG
jgi:dTDP-4-dehydrorhamnose 3,5-epimerase